MGCETETKQIGEHEYSVTQWPAEKSILMQMRLIKAFGSSIATLVSAIEDKDESGGLDIDPAILGKSLNSLFAENSPDEITALLKECVIGVACDGQRISSTSFNELFSGNELITVYKIFIFVIQVNYSNLFNGQIVGDFLAKVKAPQ